jgi:autotransporter-associated beta strand protein
VTAIVDDYKNELNASPADPTVPVLSEFLQHWKPGTAWNNGTALNSAVLTYNNDYVFDATWRRTAEEEIAAHYDDRRNQSYSIIDGLGPLTSLYLAGAQSVTTIPAFDSTTLATEYDDAGTGNPGGSLTSPLASTVALVNNLRSFSATPDKNYYNYPRPWRLNSSGVVEDTGTTQTATVTIVNGASTTTQVRTWNVYDSNDLVAPSLLAVRSTTAASDQGFPSGHENAGNLAALALAYAIPERFQELVTRASELGYHRIVAGMHSPLDVMGGRMSSTAWAAAILYNNDMSGTAAPVITKGKAYTDAHNYPFRLTGRDANSLFAYAHKDGIATDRFADWAANKSDFATRLTYGFAPLNSTANPVVVPKGAEVLLETRQPYLDSSQRRWVLYTTGIASGYPLLDDAEGWGRLNLFDAADGYGAFYGNVIVKMDASLGGFNASDTWRNDISGTGKLFKQGTGTLKLAGHNSYSGGTQIDVGGVLEADSRDALGTGDVVLNGGTLVSHTNDPLLIAGNYNQLSGSTLEIDLGRDGEGELTILGDAGYAGTLDINVQHDFQVVPGETFDVITTSYQQGAFATVNVTGTSAKWTVVYSDRGLHLKFHSDGRRH